MDQRVSEARGHPAARLYRPAPAGSRRQDVRKIDGVRAGVHQESVRIGRAGRLQSDPGLPRRGLQLGGTFHGPRESLLRHPDHRPAADVELSDPRVGIGERQEHTHRQHRIGRLQGEGQISAALLPGVQMVPQRIPEDAVVRQRDRLRSGQHPSLSRRFQSGRLRGIPIGLLQKPPESPGAHLEKKLTEDLTMHRIPNAKNDSTKVQYRDPDGSNVLTVGKKEFNHTDQSTFKQSWLRHFDRELESLRSILYEYPITFPPSYPYEEDPGQPGSYMATRCPAWCDRILISPAARRLIEGIDERENGKHQLTMARGGVEPSYGIIGEDVCMGDHKPIFLSIRVKTSQGTCQEMSDDDLHTRLQEYEDLNARICDEPSYQQQGSAKSHYIQFTPTQSQESTTGSETNNTSDGGGGDGTTTTTTETVSSTSGGEDSIEGDSVFYQQGPGSGPNSMAAMIFRETTV
ncbi:uncharacterized protein LOC129740150 isoform X2 [Uranotaenia lowii]|uniref:uncharacterized protein LOC129740150 isoform X2 n=1 Tax=Uranotaenia lowii TaxID=190385 RepID=UPI002478C558|nr:uncharacterized protein LOC129740150 isoform X2 [Uranotaenia lowii]